MRIIILLTSVFLLFSCSSQPPKPIQPEGEISNVNPLEINLEEIFK